jgi:hypothetical protein
MSRVLPLLAPSALLTLTALAACSDQKVGAFNAPPEAQITSPADGDTALSGTTLTRRGAASDATHDAAELTARWFVDDAEACAQMPAGVPVATVAVNNATNAGLLAVQILGTADAGLRQAMQDYKQGLEAKVLAAAERVGRQFSPS